MTPYQAPVETLSFTLRAIADLAEVQALPGFEEASDDLVEAVLDEAGRFFSEVVAPSNQEADRQGTRLEDRSVVTAPVLDPVYAAYRDGDWCSLAGDPAWGGQGLPHLVGSAVDQMLQSANLSFSLMPMLTQGVITALSRYGSPEQRETYLGKLVTGRWSGTMMLTEPQAGSDLAAVKTLARPEGDHYRLSGQKIYITWGDQSFTENIVHLVLARTPDAPAGVKGISLFIVPKHLPDADGGIGDRNDIYPVGIEHKLGIHASPTCTMAIGENDGAVGYLVGEENQGLKYMFAMMNHARLAVGQQGVAIAERSYQQARAFARERVQGRGPDGRENVPIVEHPDVRRMLLTMKALTQGGRALTAVAMAHFDGAIRSPEPERQARHQRRVDWLTPLVKGWCTEMCNEVTSLGIQVHGGMGYVEETGAAQHFRDARIGAIYEGTNGIQALDLVGRKTLANGGEYAREWFQDSATVVSLCREQDLDDLAQATETALEQSRQAVEIVLARSGEAAEYAGSVAFDLLMLLGTAAVQVYLAKGAAQAVKGRALGQYPAPFLDGQVVLARFFAERLTPRMAAHLASIKTGHGTLMAMPEEEL